jgi:hypothetical protein
MTRLLTSITKVSLLISEGVRREFVATDALLHAPAERYLLFIGMILEPEISLGADRAALRQWSGNVVPGGAGG